MVPPAIRMDGLTRRFGGRTAVDGLTLDVGPGQVFGFLGPNGSGKTTTIGLLLGLLEPDAGAAQVLGFDTRAQADRIRAGCGALLEHPGVYEQLSAEENLEFYARAWRMGPRQRAERIEELLRRMGLWDRRREKAGGWSRGMRQKLGLARALLHRPMLVFLDEPTAGLDVMAAADVRGQLADLAAGSGVTVFLTTHNMAEAETLCAEVAVIRDGRLLAQGRPDELRRRAGRTLVTLFGRGFSGPLVRRLRERDDVLALEADGGRLEVSLALGADTSPIVRAVVESGAQVEEVVKHKASLEEAFLELMEEPP